MMVKLTYVLWALPLIVFRAEATFCSSLFEDVQDQMGQLTREQTLEIFQEAEVFRNSENTNDISVSLSKFCKAASIGQGPGVGSALHALAKIYEEGGVGETDHHASWTSWTTGMNIERNISASLDLYNKSATTGNPHAQFTMGVYYASSSTLFPGTLDKLLATTGVFDSSTNSNDTFEALAVLNYYFGALGGDGLASMALGFRHHQGYGVPANCDAALLYYEMAANLAIDRLTTNGFIEGQDRTRLSTTVGKRKGLGISAFQYSFDTEVVQYHEWLAEQGNLKSMLALGDIYYHGTQAIQQDPERAANWYAKAAEAGDGQAMGTLGHMYLKGVGVEKDHSKALQYFLKGRKKHDPSSINGLGVLTQLGDENNSAKDGLAAEYFKEASERGDMDALYNLALMHLTGPPKKIRKASAKAKKGKPAGKGSRQTSSGNSKQYAAEIKADGSTSTVPTHQAEAESSSDGDKDDIDSRVPRRDLAKAVQLITLAAHNGHLKSLHKLGQMYAEAVGVSRSCSSATSAFKSVAERVLTNRLLSQASKAFALGDYEFALAQYLRAAEAGSEIAQSNAAWMLLNGYGTSTYCKLPSHPCDKEALRMYQNAARQGRSEAALKVGDFYYYGRGGLDADRSRAVGYYQQAVDQRNAQAMFNLAYMYQFGEGVARRDFHLAKRYFDMAYSTSTEARIPAQMGLFVLWMHMLLSEFTSGLDESEESDLKSMLAIPISALMEIVAVDTLLIIVLLSMLIYILKHRWRPLPRRLREASEAGAGPSQGEGGSESQTERPSGNAGSALTLETAEESERTVVQQSDSELPNTSLLFPVPQSESVSNVDGRVNETKTSETNLGRIHDGSPSQTGTSMLTEQSLESKLDDTDKPGTTNDGLAENTISSAANPTLTNQQAQTLAKKDGDVQVCSETSKPQQISTIRDEGKVQDHLPLSKIDGTEGTQKDGTVREKKEQQTLEVAEEATNTAKMKDHLSAATELKSTAEAKSKGDEDEAVI